MYFTNEPIYNLTPEKKLKFSNLLVIFLVLLLQIICQTDIDIMEFFKKLK